MENIVFHGHLCKLVITTYAKGNRKELLLNLMEDDSPVATCTLNIDEQLDDNEVCIKNYSENTGMVELLVSYGVINWPHNYSAHGFPICKLLI